MIRLFDSKSVDACYLGVWRESDRRLFGRTSLSSKLTAYAAASVPVIVDAEEDAAVWRLVEQHAAGIRLGRDCGEDLEGLERLFGDHDLWVRMAHGARRLCLEELSLERNVERFRATLHRTATSENG
jgi:hypothetical protein